MKTDQVSARFMGEVTPALNFQKREKATQPEKVKPAESKAIEKEKIEEEKTGVKDRVDLAAPINKTAPEKKSVKPETQPKEKHSPGKQAKAFYSTINTDAEAYKMEQSDARRKSGNELPHSKRSLASRLADSAHFFTFPRFAL